MDQDHIAAQVKKDTKAFNLESLPCDYDAESRQCH